MSTFIQELKKIPIFLDREINLNIYRNNKIRFHNRVFKEINVKQCHELYDEALVSCHDYEIDCRNYFLHNSFYKNDPYIRQYLAQDILLRKNILFDLQKIDQVLKKNNLALLLVSGYRHPDLQKLIVKHQRFIDSEKQLSFWEPTNYLSHSTGAAFDIEIFNLKTKQVLLTDLPGCDETLSLENKKQPSALEKEVRANRRLIHNLLTSDCVLNKDQRFIAHPFEHWHFSRNERLAAFFCKDNHEVFYEALI